MKSIKFPLYIYKIWDGSYCGTLLGWSEKIDMISPTKKKLIADISSKVQKGHIDEDFEIKNLKMKIIKIEFYTVYKEPGKIFPVKDKTIIPVPVVYGEKSKGYFIAFIPIMDAEFFYYDKKQLDDLVKHFTRDKLNAETPESINRFLINDEPELELISINLSDTKNKNRYFNLFYKENEFLSEIADELPIKKSLRKKMHIFPEVAWERSIKINEIYNMISKEKANVIIVGNSGSGKSAVISEVIKKLSKPKKKDEEKHSFWRTSPDRIIASAKYLGEWQKNCDDLVEELEYENGFMYLQNLIELFKIGGEGSEDSMAAYLNPYLQKGNLHMIAELSNSELSAVQNIMPAFLDNFNIIELEDMDRIQTFKVLEGFRDFISRNFKIDIEEKAVETGYLLLKRYMKYESFPGKAITYFSSILNDLVMKKKHILTATDVIDKFISNTGIPGFLIRDEEILDIEEMEFYFKKRIIGQDDAIKKLTDVIKIFKTGLNDPEAPISTMLFAGPTGVGKTACVKALSEYMFLKGQKQNPLIRFDMSEFRYPWQIERLIGGHGSTGKLVEEVRQNPFSVILFDEIEKADRSIFNFFLTLFDEGKVVDYYGRSTDFRNTIIIMTSNIGAKKQNSIGFGVNDNVNYYSAIANFFVPEFINRIDHIVPFKSLDDKAINEITKKELEELKKREGFLKRGIVLEISENLLDYIAKKGFDKDFGARPLQRVIESELSPILAKFLVENPDIKNTKIKVDYKNERVIIL